MDRESIINERVAFYNAHIRKVLAKYMPDVSVLEVRKMWTTGWEATLSNGDVVVFDHTSYFDDYWKHRIDYYFRSRKTLKTVIYERR